MFNNSSNGLYLSFSILAAVATLSVLFRSTKQSRKEKIQLARREKLPADFKAWKTLNPKDHTPVWQELRPLLEQHGFTLWPSNYGTQCWYDDLPECDNFLFLTSHKENKSSALNWNRFLTGNVLCRHAARMNNVRDVILRVIATSGEGQTHLRILKRLCSPPDSLMSGNHFLPILAEIFFEDIVILAVPKLIFNLIDATFPTCSNSVEDVLYMVLQALEGVAYLHRNLIGHQDLFLSNFMVEFMPESMNERTSVARPRVYVIDFETAVEFPEESLESERTTMFPWSLVPWSPETYTRPVAPELRTWEPYCPFRLDMWQLGTDLHNNALTGIDEIQQLWLALCRPDPKDRITVNEALSYLDTYLRKTPSLELHQKLEDSDH